MDKEDAEQLVARLCTVAGMLMEDALPSALFRPENAGDGARNLALLQAAVADIAALIYAAQVIARHSEIAARS